MCGRRWLAVVVAGLIVGWAGTASAKFVVWDHGGEKIVKITDFPDTEEFRSTDGHNFDAGAIYKRFRVFNVPLWVYDVRWCGYISETLYMELDTVGLSTFARSAGVTLPVEPPIPFWDQWGGKLVVLFGLVALCIGTRYYYQQQHATTEPEEPVS